MVEKAEQKQREQEAFKKLGTWSSLKTLKLNEILEILNQDISNETFYMLGVMKAIRESKERGDAVYPESDIHFLKSLDSTERITVDALRDILQILRGLKDGLTSIDKKVNNMNKKLKELEIRIDEMEINLGGNDDYK